MHEATMTQHIIKNYGMLDVGSMGNFIALRVNVKNECPTNNPLKIVIIDGTAIHFT